MPAARQTFGSHEMNRLSVWKWAMATALALAVLNALCAAAVMAAPDATLAVFNSWMHGVDLGRLVPSGGRPVTFGQVVTGIVSLGAIGFVAGAIVAGAYNAMTASPRSDSITGRPERSA